MHARATTTISVYRGQADDEWGDPKDLTAPIATGIRAAISEQKVYAKGEITTQPRSFRYARMRVTHGTDISINDRIFDEKTEFIWTIMNISSNQNPAITQDMRVDLQYMG
jgi:hypothetical protein